MDIFDLEELTEITKLTEKEILEKIDELKRHLGHKEIAKVNVGKSARIGLANVNKSRRWLADRVGISPSYMTNICNGEKVPNGEMLIRLSMAFGVKVSEFISWGEEDDTTSI